MAKDSSKAGSGNQPAPTKNRYHHGNLRESLLEAALAYLKTDTLDNLSLRSLAKTVGVSATAVYSHFADKTDLLIDLRTLGFRLLTEHLTRALEAQPESSGEIQVRLLGHAYMSFAAENPNLFDNLFSWAPERERMKSECIEAGIDSVDLLRNAILQLFRDNNLPTGDYQSSVATLSAWSLVHGLTMLIKTGSIEGAVYCGHWPDTFSAAHPKAQERAFDHLLTIEIEGLKAAVAKLTP